jgi:hypothetical protein
LRRHGLHADRQRERHNGRGNSSKHQTPRCTGEVTPAG